MISDLTVIWSLFSEVYELLKESKVDIARFFAADPRLEDEFQRIFREGGEFWDSPSGTRSLRRVPVQDAVPGRLKDIWMTLRNGNAHFHWRYENLSALDYFTRQGWDTSNAAPIFDIVTRPADNYLRRPGGTRQERP